MIKLLKQLKEAWMSVAAFLARINGMVLLFLLFFLVVTPIGILARILHKLPLAHERDADPSWLPFEEDSPDPRKPF